MSVDKDELLKEIERCEYEKPRLVMWTQMDEFRLQVMKDLAAANATIADRDHKLESWGKRMCELADENERLSAPVSDEEWTRMNIFDDSEYGVAIQAFLAARAQGPK